MSKHTPTPKVAGGTVAGALAIVLVWAVGLTGVDMPAEVAAAIGFLAVSATSYLIPDRTSPGRHAA